eukprot:TRINITY_DN44128_c0_g1_i1.p2 TRINITY_DN44128_c0_g1~~TRINITY_DN44128_c0_g1_i1.p2  ORF type:complete len:389 (+),score=143.44 TRINITY_DN44128_c0_g1_i1:62-1228(+)
MRCAAALSLAAGAWGLDNGLARTPPMGFNDWNEIAAKYPPWQKGVNETIFLAVGETMNRTGLVAKGYKYLNLDCGYAASERGSDGKLVADAKLFPSGMPAVAAKVRALGMKFGIYTSGKQCCAPLLSDNGNLGKEAQDATQFVEEWGVEYVKNDDCGSEVASFSKFRDALNKTGKPVLYSIHTKWTHSTSSGISPETSAPVANIWRTTGDIKNNWPAVLDRAVRNNAHAAAAGPGGFNDPDMLEVGNGLTDAESRSHFAMWCVMKAPLLIGTDVTAASDATLATLGNAELIAVNQDPLGKQGTLRANDSNHQLWAGELTSSCHAIVYVNTADSVGGGQVNLTACGLPADKTWTVRNLWTHQDAGTASQHLTVAGVQPHDNAAYKLCPV